MLVSIDTLKEYLGLPPAADPELDPILERSSMIAQTLAESYIGTPIEQDPASPKTAAYFQLWGVRVVRLQEFPTALVSLSAEGVTVPAAEYTFNPRTGTLEFTLQRNINSLELVHTPGFTPETVPKDIETAIANMAIGIYENGGKINSTQSSAGALKSMTMFDAMSMSFDTGTASADAGSPEGIVSQWAFVLDKYRVDKYIMGAA